MKLDKTVEARIRNAAPKKQKGASSLEYMMLAAVLVGILVVVANTDLGETVKTFFTDIFGAATDEAGIE
ncbi:MAG: Flp family type IVb pilin [Marinobacter sp.]|uniref:Flp family type IVb pilin n=1 Tax=Marinobacter sp. TaxID=50741 RepID=UPI002B26E28B|nr:Flp family type IVb pilin [Marinobacter sp.]